MDQIYLDNNATTRMLPEVADAIDAVNRAEYANPASQHQSGQHSRRKLDNAREGIVELLGGNIKGLEPDRLILTSGGTEANNIALRGLTMGVANANIVISSVEHPSISATAIELAKLGFEVRYLPVNRQGVVELEKLNDLLDDHTRLISVMLGNHETGVLQPVEELARIARKRRIMTHCDAIQAVGKIDVNFRSLGVDALSVSAHKLHGPVGIGGLLLRHNVIPTPIVTGGFQQQGIRPGTESVSLAIGFLKAMEICLNQLVETESRIRHLRDKFEARLKSEISSLVINSGETSRLPHVSNLSFPGLNRQALVMGLDMAGIACSTGSACASGSSEPSPVLLAMNVEEAVVEGSFRISLSRLTTSEELEQTAKRIIHFVDSRSL